MIITILSEVIKYYIIKYCKEHLDKS